MRATPIAGLSGFVFALGLGLAGMTRNTKVLAFLDLAGTWDPSLVLVMVAAIASFALGYRKLTAHQNPVLKAAYRLPTRTDIDRRLVLGAALFGIGWGLVGLCPGPALTDLASANASVWLFVAAMLVGMAGANVATR